MLLLSCVEMVWSGYVYDMFLHFHLTWYDNREVCKFANMQFCKDITQQMALKIQEQNDMTLWGYKLYFIRAFI